jgi:hypothetical protein
MAGSESDSGAARVTRGIPAGSLDPRAVSAARSRASAADHRLSSRPVSYRRRQPRGAGGGLCARGSGSASRVVSHRCRGAPAARPASVPFRRRVHPRRGDALLRACREDGFRPAHHTRGRSHRRASERDRRGRGHGPNDGRQSDQARAAAVSSERRCRVRWSAARHRPRLGARDRPCAARELSGALRLVV